MLQLRVQPGQRRVRRRVLRAGLPDQVLLLLRADHPEQADQRRQRQPLHQQRADHHDERQEQDQVPVREVVRQRERRGQRHHPAHAGPARARSGTSTADGVPGRAPTGSAAAGTSPGTARRTGPRWSPAARPRPPRPASRSSARTARPARSAAAGRSARRPPTPAGTRSPARPRCPAAGWPRSAGAASGVRGRARPITTASTPGAVVAGVAELLGDGERDERQQQHQRVLQHRVVQVLQQILRQHRRAPARSATPPTAATRNSATPCQIENPPTTAAPTATRYAVSAVASLTRLSPARIVIIRRGSPTVRPTAVAATASGGDDDRAERERRRPAAGPAPPRAPRTRPRAW